MAYSFFLVVVGLVLLTVGAEGLVRAGVSFALRLGVTPLVIGLTIVAFGTGSPELVVTIKASLDGNSGLALGNVIGSNISNTALILGVAALIYPIEAKSQVVRREMPIMIAVTAMLWIMILDGELGRIDGIILLTGSIVYTVAIYLLSKRAKVEESLHLSIDIPGEPPRLLILDIVYFVVGLSVLVFGASILIEGAVEIARIFNISDVVVGLTIIAIGTSLPELATSAVASLRKESDLALGNAIGSNIVNILCVLGIGSIIAPISAAEIRVLDMIAILGSGLFLWALLGFRFLLDRFEAAILILLYAAYLYTLIP